MSATDELCAEVGIAPPPGWSRYFDTTKAWGARTDLTSAKNDGELAEVLFLDAAHLVEASWLPGTGTLIDIGAGVGAPTLPLLAANTHVSGLLVEPRRRRVAFLRSAIGVLGLAGRADVLERKIDPDKPRIDGQTRGIAISRATFDPTTWQRIGIALADEVWVFTAGAQVEETSALVQARRLTYQVPSTGAPRAVYAFRHR
ncbi:MAG: RsmG family class I SAM-dependent methyltransferase [Polyangiales bacterium]